MQPVSSTRSDKKRNTLIAKSPFIPKAGKLTKAGEIDSVAANTRSHQTVQLPFHGEKRSLRQVDLFDNTSGDEMNDGDKGDAVELDCSMEFVDDSPLFFLSSPTKEDTRTSRKQMTYPPLFPQEPSISHESSTNLYKNKSTGLARKASTQSLLSCMSLDSINENRDSNENVGDKSNESKSPTRSDENVRDKSNKSKSPGPMSRRLRKHSRSNLTGNGATSDISLVATSDISLVTPPMQQSTVSFTPPLLKQNLRPKQNRKVGSPVDPSDVFKL